MSKYIPYTEVQKAAETDPWVKEHEPYIVCKYFTDRTTLYVRLRIPDEKFNRTVPKNAKLFKAAPYGSYKGVKTLTVEAYLTVDR